MIAAFSSALSRLSVFANQIALVARNAVNVYTAGFEQNRAGLCSTRPNGVEAHIEMLTPPSSMIMTLSSGGTRLVEQSNVDRVEEITALLMANRIMSQFW